MLLQLIMALGAALLGGALAAALRQSVILGYLLAGVAIGPFTPGFVGPTSAIEDLAEVGVVFLMFAVGAQLPLRELVRASRIATTGALLQVGGTLAVGYLAGRLLGWSDAEAFAFGAVISNSSSTVLSKVLTDRGELDTGHARIGLVWSSVQDISTVALLAALAALAARGEGVLSFLGGPALFLFVLVPIAFVLLPWLFRSVERFKSREIFILFVAAVALSMSWVSSRLGISPALGAFLAGVIAGESDLAHRVLGDAIPLRDVFSGVFFVSVGMLLDPRFIVLHWELVLFTTLLIVIVKGLLTTATGRLVGCSPRTAVLVGAGLAQSGEFSFILARAGETLGIVTPMVFSLMLSATALSIILAPWIGKATPALLHATQRRGRASPLREPPSPAAALRQHAIICGYGRVGGIVRAQLERLGVTHLVIEDDARLVGELRTRGGHALLGDATQAHILDQAGVDRAAVLLLCIPERLAVRQIIAYAHSRNPGLPILARTHDESERKRLHEYGAAHVVMGETELAFELTRLAAEALRIDPRSTREAIEAARRERGAPS